MQLSEWLAREGVNRNQFAERVGIAPSTIYDVCSGRIAWPRRRIIEAIERGTRGEVTAADFLHAAQSTD